CDWSVCLMIAGRGAGKTRAGAEWVRALALGDPDLPAGRARRIALIGQTHHDVRQVMIEGVSGLAAVHRPDQRPVYEPTNRRLVWPGGVVAQGFSAEEPDSLRGPQFEAAWCDELAKWRYPEETWDMLQFALRLGTRPRVLVTTTPRPLKLLRRLIEMPGTAVSRATTFDNRENLADGFVAGIEARYGGTRLGRQELEAEILTDNPRALWRRAAIEAARVDRAPELSRVVGAVDPPASSRAGADCCGIVCAGGGTDGLAYVLADATVRAAAPTGWARAAAAVYHRFAADRLVAEVNQGGEMVEAVMRQVDPQIAYRGVRARRGKWLRAEPVAALYEQRRVRHVGALPELEDEMCEFEPNGLAGGRSPDRVDALVWALGELMLRPLPEPRVRMV